MASAFTIVHEDLHLAMNKMMHKMQAMKMADAEFTHDKVAEVKTPAEKAKQFHKNKLMN